MKFSDFIKNSSVDIVFQFRYILVPRSEKLTNLYPTIVKRIVKSFYDLSELRLFSPLHRLPVESSVDRFNISRGDTLRKKENMKPILPSRRPLKNS